MREGTKISRMFYIKVEYNAQKSIEEMRFLVECEFLCWAEILCKGIMATTKPEKITIEDAGGNIVRVMKEQYSLFD